MFTKGRKKTGGRVKGSPKSLEHEEMKQAARLYGAASVHKLAELAGLLNEKGQPRKPHEPAHGASSNPQTIAFCCERLLDRGYGKPVQPIGGDADNPFRVLADYMDGITRGIPSQAGLGPQSSRDGTPEEAVRGGVKSDEPTHH